jgi:PilZ domain
MSERRPEKERRRWSRLPLAIPVFVRSHDQNGRDSLEFATSLNVSAGGMLLAVRRAFKPEAQLRLEIPSAPVATMAGTHVARTLQGRALRVAPADGYYILGIKFGRPLRIGNRPPRKRKFVSTL